MKKLKMSQKVLGKTTFFEPTCTIDFLYKMKVMMAVLILMMKTSEKLEMPSLRKVELNQKIFAQPQWLKIWREQQQAWKAEIVGRSVEGLGLGSVEGLGGKKVARIAASS